MKIIYSVQSPRIFYFILQVANMKTALLGYHNTRDCCKMMMLQNMTKDCSNLLNYTA